MKKFLIIILLIIITGCDKNDIEITRSECRPNKNQICYSDKANNEKCFDSDLCLYVNYNNEKLEINEALNKKMITLNELEQKYNSVKEELKNNMQVSYRDKTNEEFVLGAIVPFYQDEEYIYTFTPGSATYILYDNQKIDYKEALDFGIITIDELIAATKNTISKKRKEN